MKSPARPSTIQRARQGCRQDAAASLSNLASNHHGVGAFGLSGCGHWRGPTAKIAADSLPGKGYKEGKSINHGFQRDLFAKVFIPAPNAKPDD